MKQVFAVVITACVLSPLLAGCGARGTAAGYQARLDPYQGRHIDSLVSVLGPPQSTYKYENGNQVYSFVRSHYVERAQPVFGIGGFFGHHAGLGGYIGFPVTRGQIQQYRCETIITTDRKGIIKEAGFRGNGCLATQPKPGDEGLPPQTGGTDSETDKAQWQ